MRRGSTPCHTFETNIDLRGASVFVTYRQRGLNVLEKCGKDLEITENSVSCKLSQEETLKFVSGYEIKIQLRYVTEDGVADASNIVTIEADKILKDGVIVWKQI